MERDKLKKKKEKQRRKVRDTRKRKLAQQKSMVQSLNLSNICIVKIWIVNIANYLLSLCSTLGKMFCFTHQNFIF